MQYESHYEQFFTLFTISVGLLLLGCGNALLGGGNRWRTLAVVSIASLVCVGLANMLIEQLVPWFTGVGFACVVLVYCSSLKQVRSLVANRSLRWSCVAVGGLGLLAVSCWQYDAQSNANNNEAYREFQRQFSQPPSVEDSTVQATTDIGTPLHLKKAIEERTLTENVQAEQHYLSTMPQKEYVIRRQPATDASNCHGWVFTGGRNSLGKEDVERILSENLYAVTTTAQVHDLVIYRNAEQHISHTAIICAVLDEGVVLVEGKWGRLGVYIHDVHGSCYGDNFHYYHSPRAGHIVHGLSQVPRSSLTSSHHEPNTKH